MKIAAGFIIALGILSEYFICYITMNKPVQIPSSYFNPNLPNYKIALIICGAVIFCLALAQYFKHIKFAVWQVVCGLIIVTLPFLLYTNVLSYNISGVYLPTYIIIAVALAVIVFGLIQLFYEKD
jgi:hypothetical protein